MLAIIHGLNGSLLDKYLCTCTCTFMSEEIHLNLNLNLNLSHEYC